MNNKVFFGLYIPTGSLIHRLDPRLKIIVCFCYVIAVFFANNVWTNIWLGIILLALIKLSRVPAKVYWQGIKPLMLVIIITALVQLFFTTGGTVYWQWGWLSLTHNGIIQSLYLILRFLYIITVSTILTVSTSTLELAAGIESLMKPLKWLHVPVSQFAMMMSIALRFIPTIMDEVQTIMDAQRSRGVDFAEGSLLRRLKKFVPVMIPLFVSAMKRADDLALAMEARGYAPGAPQTEYRQLKWRNWDYWSLGLALVAILVLFGLRVY